jgi:hypothetical protein
VRLLPSRRSGDSSRRELTDQFLLSRRYHFEGGRRASLTPETTARGMRSYLVRTVMGHSVCVGDFYAVAFEGGGTDGINSECERLFVLRSPYENGARADGRMSRLKTI